jgi:membrane fusion protein, type I secretion system
LGPSVKPTQRHTEPVDTSDRDFQRRVVLGLGLVVLLFFGFGGWAASSQLSGAVIAPGRVVVDSSVKKIQHLTGGIVKEIRVKNGDRVEAGDILLRLDDTQTRATLGIVQSQLDELIARKARLAAERDGVTDIEFPQGFEALSAENRQIAGGERRLFNAKIKTADLKKAQLRERIGQYNNEIDGLVKQEKSKSQESSLVAEERMRLEDLYKKDLLPVTRVLAIRRDGVRIEGEDGALLAQIARLRGQIYEVELKIVEIGETITLDAQNEYRDVEGRIAELNERRIAAEDLLKRVDIRAPRAGLVHELAVHTVGGVIGPGEVIMGIIPMEENRTVEVHVAPTDIDHVTPDQTVLLRFPAFNQRTTPEITGNIARIAAEVSHDTESGATYYTARVELPNAELAKLGDLKLVAGMPVEAYIQTGTRSALSYLAKPVTDQITRAFKEP